MSDIATPNPPTIRTSSPITAVRTVGDLLQHPSLLARMKEVAPRHLSAERMLAVLVTSTLQTPKLRECAPMSLLGAAMASAHLGLIPNTPLGHAYILPFEVTRYDRASKTRVLERVDAQLVICLLYTSPSPRDA